MKLHVNRTASIMLAASLPLLSACSIGPEYVRPTLEAPIAFKEMDGWKTAQPRDQEIRGKWWEAYNDPVLNSLEEQVDISNQNLAQAEAHFRQATALVQSAIAGYFPIVSGNLSASRSGGASGRTSQSLTSSGSVAGDITDSRSLSVNATWEADVWGRVRRTVEANQASEQASAADLEATRLSTQAQLAQSYFQLRAAAR